MQGNLEIERLHLQPLLVERFADYELAVAVNWICRLPWN
jgi:hypothetical protein